MRHYALLLAFVVAAPAMSQLAVHDGDRVVFYGDSITDNAPYPTYVEQFLVSRYPKLNIEFMNAGVGGDRVTGGWMGPIDQRMTRDLFSRKPTVVTIMLGMNDASYRPFDQGIFDTFQNGYRHMADRLKAEAPNARVWLIQPSPFDDVNQPLSFPGGYNGVLKRYADFVGELAKDRGYGVIDFNTPMVQMLTAANAANAADAKKLIPDRVHPGPAGHLVMADALLKSLRVSPMISETTFDWSTGKGYCVGGTVSNLDRGKFTLTESGLPFWMNKEDGLIRLVLESSSVEQDLNREVLKVSNMPAGQYQLKIDGQPVGKPFSSDAFSQGIDLASLDTPMMQQAQRVADLTNRIVALRYNRWRNFEFGMSDVKASQKDHAIDAIEKLESALEAERKEVAQPKSHTFEVSPA